MKEAFVSKGPKVIIRDVPIPSPGPNQVLTKVVFSGTNPKDWKRAENAGADKPPVNQGDDISGIVEAVGEGVYEFKKGDRVAAFHEMTTPHGSWAEYAISWDHTTFHLPAHTSFEEGATLPLAAMTAACALYAKLRLPPPWSPSTSSAPTPLVIYGASSAIGSYAIQLARQSNIHPLICIAGRARSHVASLIDPSKGDVVLDYRSGPDAVAQGIRDALPAGAKLEHAFDGVSEKGSYQTICRVLDGQAGKITFVLPGREYEDVPAGVEKSITMVGEVHAVPEDLRDFGFVYFRLITRGLKERWFKSQPHEVVDGGLEGVEKALKNLKEGNASAVKYVFKIADTPGVAAA